MFQWLSVFCWWCVQRISSSRRCMFFSPKYQYSLDSLALAPFLTFSIMTPPQPECLQQHVICCFQRSDFKVRFCWPSNVRWILWWELVFNQTVQFWRVKHTLLAMFLSERTTPSCLWYCLPGGFFCWHLLFSLQKMYRNKNLIAERCRESAAYVVEKGSKELYLNFLQKGSNLDQNVPVLSELLIDEILKLYQHTVDGKNMYHLWSTRASQK